MYLYNVRTYTQGGFNMKIKKALIIPAVCTALIAGAGVGLALSQKASLNKKVEVAEAASSASYTMTAREILAGKVTNYNDTIEIVDDVMRVTSTVAGQFNIHLQSADGTHMGKLLRNATSITFSVKISAASEFNKNVVCRYKDTSATNKWIYSTMNLNNAETGFTDVTFNAPEDLDYFEVPTFQSEVVGGYIDIRSLTFNGLTGFTNPSYTAIASGWNHGGYGGNAVLLAFNQTLGSAANTTNVAAQLADKVTINGVAIADISGGKISYDHGNNYFWVHYSADSILPTAAFPKTILEVKDGTLFQDAILNGVKLAFDTATNVWVDDDIVLHDLVANGDYTLFTVENMASNSDFPFYTGSSIAQIEDHNFGVQFNVVANTDVRNHFYIRFGTAVANNDYYEVCIDPNLNNNLYISRLNGTGGPIEGTVKGFSMTTGVDYKFECYSIKDSATTANFVLAINGKIYINYKASIADPYACGFFCIMQGSGDKTANTFSVCPTTNGEAIARFGKKVLHTDDIPFSDNTDTGNCLNYYANAKAYYTNRLVRATKLLIANDATYVNIKNRLVAWAAANGETITLNMWTGEIEVQAANGMIAVINKNNAVVIVVVVSMMALSFLAVGMFYYRKRKHN